MLLTKTYQLNSKDWAVYDMVNRQFLQGGSKYDWKLKGGSWKDLVKRITCFIDANLKVLVHLIIFPVLIMPHMVRTAVPPS